MENMVNAGVKGILITPSDTKAIVPAIRKARKQGVLVIALDTATEPQNAVDALFATNNFEAGLLIGQWAKAAMKGKTPVIATLDLQPGITVGAQRHNGFLQGMGLRQGRPNSHRPGDRAGGGLQPGHPRRSGRGPGGDGELPLEEPRINLVYSINEPAAFGAYTAIKAAGKEKRDHHRHRRRWLPRRAGRGRRQDRRDLAAVPAQDGHAGCRGAS